MTDREMLEYAAKAAGIDLYIWVDCVLDYDSPHFRQAAIQKGNSADTWNPLIDDGDAFRLAVKLNLTIDFDVLSDGAIVNVYASWNGDFRDCFWNEWLGKEPYAATRRAIVRAAAEIGRMM